MKKWLKLTTAALAVLAFAAGCGSSGSTEESASSENTKQEEVTVKLGLIGADTDVWDSVKDRLKDEGITRH
jgi:D-methionine transport system substrate-binding protein